jgi:hypothetical protein
MTLNNLLTIAAGFDIAFVARFVPFSELATWLSGLRSERDLFVPSFEEDSIPIEGASGTEAVIRMPLPDTTTTAVRRRPPQSATELLRHTPGAHTNPDTLSPLEDAIAGRSYL